MNLKQWQKYLWTFVDQFRGALELQRLISLHWVEICSPNFFVPSLFSKRRKTIAWKKFGQEILTPFNDMWRCCSTEAPHNRSIWSTNTSANNRLLVWMLSCRCLNEGSYETLRLPPTTSRMDTSRSFNTC